MQSRLLGGVLEIFASASGRFRDGADDLGGRLLALALTRGLRGLVRVGREQLGASRMPALGIFNADSGRESGC